MAHSSNRGEQTVGRRDLVRGLGAVIGSGLLAGCEGIRNQTIKAKAKPVGVPKEKLEEMQFNLRDAQELTVTRTRKLEGITIEATVTSYLTQYTDRKAPGVAAFLSTPPVQMLGFELNPAVKNSIPDLVEQRPKMFNQLGSLPVTPGSLAIERVEDPTQVDVNGDADVYFTDLSGVEGIQFGNTTSINVLGDEVSPEDVIVAFALGKQKPYYTVMTKLTAKETGDTVITAYAGAKLIGGNRTGNRGDQVGGGGGGSYVPEQGQLSLIATQGEQGLFTVREVRRFNQRAKFIGVKLGFDIRF